MTSGGALSGRIALVTGGGRGIGRATAVALAAAGAAVVPVSRRLADLEETHRQIKTAGGRAPASPLAADVRRPEMLADVVSRARAELGDVDILVAAAGSARFRPVLETTDDEWAEQIGVNLTGAWNAIRAVLPAMIATGRGDIVLVASVAARKAFANCAAYGASKAGLVMLGDVLREETRGRGVRVTSLIAGATTTDIWGESLPAPLERMMPPEMVAAAIVDAVATPARGAIEEIVLRPRLGDL